MYKTINGYTKQDIIDKINTEFKGKAYNKKRSSCVYLNEDGKKCAVGLFIPNGSPAAHSMDGINYLLENFPELKSAMPLDLDGLKNFQLAHDKLEHYIAVNKQKEKLIEWVNKNVE